MQKCVAVCLAFLALTLGGCKATGLVLDALLNGLCGGEPGSFANGNYVQDGVMKGPDYADDPLKSQR